MAITKEIVEYVANLSRIDLNEKELEKLSGQLTVILDFIDTLKNKDITDVKPTSHILPISNVLREDIPKASLSPLKTLENSPETQGNFFVVPKVIE
jgi:aspartyl-tRNA(Asn)/glutamyl-tRNA(Gln) amidotransferase subunit C